MKQLTYDENIQAIAKETSDAYGAHIVPSGCITSAMVTIRRIQGALGFALCEAGWDADCVEKYLKEQGWLPDDEQALNPTPYCPDKKNETVQEAPQATSTERLTAKQVLDAKIDEYFSVVPANERSDFARKLPVPAYEVALKSIEVYAAQEIEHKTKQLQEEKQLALELLAQCDAYQLPEWLADKVQALFHQLNHNNEG